MRQPPAAPALGPDEGRAAGPPARGRPDHPVLTALGRSLGLITVLALGSVSWQHWAVFPADGGPAAHGPYLLADLALALYAAATAVLLVQWARRAVGPRFAARWENVVVACATALTMTALFVPLAMAQAVLHRALGGAAGGHHHGAGALPDDGAMGLLRYGVGQAAQVEVAILTLALLGAVPAHVWLAPRRWAESRRHARSGRSVFVALPARPRRHAVGMRLALVAALSAALLAPVGSAVAEPGTQRSAGAGSCATAPQREFDVSAINVDITVDRFGDHDPYGMMYVLDGRLDAVREQEAALLRASKLPKNDPTAAKVSVGLGQDAIQPLVIRARLGECVVINLTNKLEKAPRSGSFGNPAIVQPGGVPSVSVDMAGVAFDAAGGAGGQAVGKNPESAMAAPGQTKQYRYYLDPLMGEGAKVFRSGGDSTQMTAHGLFGTLIAEPVGARWYDPMSGADRTDETSWSNWEAMIKPADGRSFREFTLIYHEIGDEAFNLRRPLRENDEGIPFGGDDGKPHGDQVEYGRPLPMIDTRPPSAAIPNEGGGGTASYRPGSRAINYRSEPFMRRLQLEAARGAAVQRANKSLAYSSYTYGDPATPMPRSYLGEPTKTRLADAGVEQLHVHHVHGGGTRWWLNPGADDTTMGAGLTKNPVQKAKSVRLDSQTVSPLESFNLEHECGAGGCQQAAGDFLYHCHISQHYVTGMWGLWRVFDTAQPTLAPLPGRDAAPDAVNSAGLLGRTVLGKKVVLAKDLTDPTAQVALEKLVEDALPPQGTRWQSGSGSDPDDATVWDWRKGGTDESPVYLGEPETTAVWADYRSPDPGERPEILFNPLTGRPAYPMLRPHLGQRPPFAPHGHAGAPGVGETVSDDRPGGLCPRGARVRDFDVTAVPVSVRATARERDDNGEIYVLNEDKAAVLDGRKPVDPLVIRSNVGDCVAITFGSELKTSVQAKANMHTHLVQFDPLASDGVVAGFAFEQGVFSTAKENRTLVSQDAPEKVTVSQLGQLRTGVSVAVGVGRSDIEIRTIKAIDGDQLTFDRPLEHTHEAGSPVTVEFVQYRWFSDADSGTVFWHDHVDGMTSWARGLFAAHIIEPKGSEYRDPGTGAEVRSGTIVDIVNRSGGSVGYGQSGSFREFTIFLHNGRRGRGELYEPPSATGLNPFNQGQECEEGSINLRAAPLGERTPPGATPADPRTTDQRQEYNGARCRNATSRAPYTTGNPDATTARATVTTVDPYVFSSVKYGDPDTPLLRAYAGDPVVIRTVGVNDRGEALRIQGHRFRLERFNGDGQLTDTATTGISERADYVLDGGAGGPKASPGDYLYYSTRTFALESGAWGLFRVHDKRQSDLLPLPGRPEPPNGDGFPRQKAATGDTQSDPGPAPAPAYTADGEPDTTVVTSTATGCPAGAPKRHYAISVFDKTLPTAPFQDTGGVVYALTSDVAAIKSGTKPVEPLVLRADKGDCLTITLKNETSPDSLYGGRRAGLDMSKLVRNQQLSAGSAVGLNPDSTVAVGKTITYTFHADRELGSSLFQNLGSPASLRHGAYGMLIVEPKGSTWSDSETGARLDATRTSTEAIIRAPGGRKFREFALTMQSTDQHFSRSITPYGDQVAGNGLNSPDAFLRPVAPVPGAPPGTGNNSGTFDKAYNHVNYHSEPLTVRLGLTASVDDFSRANVIGSYGAAFGSATYGDPDTPVFRANSRDPVVFRVGVGASDQLHSFTVGGHTFPLEPGMKGSQMMSARTITAGETIDAHLGLAGGRAGYTGDYLFQDARMPFAAAGMWGIFRVLPPGDKDAPAPL
ncbi:hypothetical protein ACH40F_54125 [Streptomyces sp. NPDC020794]|uniref:hypothetical protein n=1 Tax=unclassified Streptomyces TaxID=2593676 RepID=UPI0036E05693